jgi:hypothetical protein
MVLKPKTVRREREDINSAIKKIAMEETTRLNVLIPVSLHQRLKIHAAQKGRGVTTTSIVISLIEEYLSKNS